jgi:catechol 2,3-dioxygenase-like lactoylglutathione lyase family enzyme
MKSIYTLLLFLSFIYAFQTKLSPTPLFMAIIVSDMETSVKFYTELLNLETENSFENETRGFKISNLKNDNIHIELLELKNAYPHDELLKTKPPKSRIHGFFKFGFKTTNFTSQVEHLKQFDQSIDTKIVTDPVSTKRTVILTDPDGNRIQFFE